MNSYTGEIERCLPLIQANAHKTSVCPEADVVIRPRLLQSLLRLHHFLGNHFTYSDDSITYEKLGELGVRSVVCYSTRTGSLGP